MNSLPLQNTDIHDAMNSATTENKVATSSHTHSSTYIASIHMTPHNARALVIVSPFEEMDS